MYVYVYMNICIFICFGFNDGVNRMFGECTEQPQFKAQQVKIVLIN